MRGMKDRSEGLPVTMEAAKKKVKRPEGSLTMMGVAKWRMKRSGIIGDDGGTKERVKRLKNC